MTEENLLSDDDLNELRKLTYGQRIGVEKLPEPLKIGAVNEELRTHLIDYLSKIFSGYINGFTDSLQSWPAEVHKQYMLAFQKRPAFRVSLYHRDVISELEVLLKSAADIDVLNFIDFYLKNEQLPLPVKIIIQDIVKACGIPVYFVGNPPIMMPIATQTDGETIAIALNSMNITGTYNAEKLLRKAIEEIKNGDAGDSIQDCAGALESIAKTYAKNGSDFRAAIKSLMKTGTLDKGLHDMFGKVWDWVNDDTHNFRHKGSKISDKDYTDEAMLMIGLTSAITTYLIKKGETAKIDMDNDHAEA